MGGDDAAAENLSAIKRSVKKGGNTNVTVIEFPGLNHLFLQCSTGTLSEYGTIDELFKEAALIAVSLWIQKTTGTD